jgi:putative photosynthetic complex assembly protein 2
MGTAPRVLLAVVFVVAAWWGATGLILHLVRRPRSTHRSTLGIATLAVVPALMLMRASSAQTTLAGAELAFASTLVLWGWLEISFLVGAVVGPRRIACPSGCRGVRHFGHAVGAILYHELAILAGAALVALLCAGQPNRIALWTFLLLWGMRISAKLNLFFGVPNTAVELLPPHLRYLGSYFRRRSLQPLLALSILMAASVSLRLVSAAASAPLGSFASFELTLLTTLAMLALIEHCMLALPLPADAPWRLLRTRPSTR